MDGERGQDVDVVFVRGFHDVTQDAPSRSLEQLVGALSDLGSLPQRMSYADLGAATRRLPGPMVRAAFVLHAAWSLFRLPDRCVVVTLEEPTGVGLTVRLGNAMRRLAGFRAHAHVSWLMDLFTLQRLQLSAQGKARARALDRTRLIVDRISLARADRIVVLGECMRSLARSLYGGERVDVVPIWQPADEFAGGDAAAVRSEWGIEPTATVVLYSGHLNYRHSVDSVPLAARRLEGEEIVFVFIGNGEKFDAMAATAAEERPVNVQFRRKAPHRPIRDVLAAGDVHLVALDEDATGTCVPSKVYAAMAASKPIVYLGSASGQGATDVLDAEAGVVVATGDVDALTDCLRRLHHDAPGRAAQGRRGRAFFDRERDLPVVAAQWQDLLTRLV